MDKGATWSDLPYILNTTVMEMHIHRLHFEFVFA